ncbi:MAG: hypothetical protein Q9179_007865 [Wetmoreana sp. 5 TL-2023]
MEQMDLDGLGAPLAGGLSEEARNALLNNDMTNPEAMAALGDVFALAPLSTIPESTDMDTNMVILRVWDMLIEKSKSGIDMKIAKGTDAVEESQHEVKMLEEEYEVGKLMLQEEQRQKEQRKEKKTLALAENFPFWNEFQPT